jgi:hypothetical protein
MIAQRIIVALVFQSLYSDKLVRLYVAPFRVHSKIQILMEKESSRKHPHHSHDGCQKKNEPSSHCAHQGFTIALYLVSNVTYQYFIGYYQVSFSSTGSSVAFTVDS